MITKVNIVIYDEDKIVTRASRGRDLEGALLWKRVRSVPGVHSSMENCKTGRDQILSLHSAQDDCLTLVLIKYANIMQ